jgi:hypothetical protein
MRTRGVRPSGALSSPDSALAYLYGTGFPGTDTGGDENNLGGGAWYLSANDILDVASAFRRQGLLSPFPDIPHQSWTDPGNVLSSYFGIDWAVGKGNPTCNGDLTIGYVYFTKNGSIPLPVYWPNGDASGFYTSANSYLWFLPNDVEIALLVNSRVGPLSFPAAKDSTNLADDPRDMLDKLIGSSLTSDVSQYSCGYGPPGCQPCRPLLGLQSGG